MGCLRIALEENQSPYSIILGSLRCICAPAKGTERFEIIEAVVYPGYNCTGTYTSACRRIINSIESSWPRWINISGGRDQIRLREASGEAIPTSMSSGPYGRHGYSVPGNDGAYAQPAEDTYSSAPSSGGYAGYGGQGYGGASYSAPAPPGGYGASGSEWNPVSFLVFTIF
eukprot:scaffold5453_cov58-Attheya_sp.AAC.9